MADSRNLGFRKVNQKGKVLLTESGLYRLIFKSRASKAEKFQDWVTDEVLPSIREKGYYGLKNVRRDRRIDVFISQIEAFTGIKAEEIAITQQESWNKRLSNLMVDCSRNGMGTMKDLYNELFYLFSVETGFDIEGIAKNMGVSRRDYIKQRPAVAKTLYEFAYQHFKRDDRQLFLIPVSTDQSTLDQILSK